MSSLDYTSLGIGGGAGIVLALIIFGITRLIIIGKKSSKIRRNERETYKLLEEDLILSTSDIQREFNHSGWVWPQQRERFQKLEIDSKGEDYVKDGSCIIIDEIEKNYLDPSKISPEFKQFSSTFGISILNDLKPKRITLLTFSIAEGVLSLTERSEPNNNAKRNQVEDEEKAIKKPKFKISDEEDRNWLVDLKTINHQNIAKFIHVCIQPPLVNFVYEFYAYGVLEDFMSQQRALLDVNARVLLVKGFLNGISFLHSNYGSHGSISCRNVFVDECFNLKIAGFGVSKFVQELCPQRDEQNSKPRVEEIFVAPEFFPFYPNMGQGSREGDVYSASMIMYMVFDQEVPFAKEKNLAVLLDNISKEGNDQLRPKYQGKISEVYHELLRQCWQFNPADRLDIQTVESRLENLYSYELLQSLRETSIEKAQISYAIKETDEYIHELEVSLVNSTTKNIKEINRMSLEIKKEKTAFKKLDNSFKETQSELNKKINDLKTSEKIALSSIQNLTETLDKEKNKCQVAEEAHINLEKELVGIKNYFLPKPLMDVAQQQIGSPTKSPTEPRPVLEYNYSGSYDGASVMIVTIVHFNKLVEQLSHSHLMLDLLRVFHDAIHKLLERFPKIYWVDRISDTCIFVSGAPDENYRHAEDIADFAFSLSQWSKGTDLDWVLGQGSNISLRMGIHSGPITAGVVGKIPKFVLLGETVNMAAKIGSECLANEIRVSYITQGILSNTIGYTFDFKGESKLKSQTQAYLLVSCPVF